MNQPLELSVILDDIESGQKARQALEGLIHNCQITTMYWDTEWRELSKIATYNVGPNVSQVAAPSVISLVAMDALSEFTPKEVALLGGASAFLPASWQSVFSTNQRQIFSLPWLADVRAIYYWRDLVEEAGVDEASAFASPEQFEHTLDRLRVSGVAHPWLLLTHFPFAALQCLASWIWGAGDEFVNANGRSLRLTEPKFRAGLHTYFDLHRYLPPGIQHMTPSTGGLAKAVSMFANRQVAVTIGSPTWLRATAEALRETPEALTRLGIASPPGPAYVGGSNLVLWKHNRQRAAALQLIQALTSPTVQASYCHQIGLLPTRLEALTNPPYSTDPHFQKLAQAAQNGRAYPHLPRWGLIEEKLSEVLTDIWADLLTHPNSDLDGVIAQRIEPLAARLNLLLAQ